MKQMNRREMLQVASGVVASWYLPRSADGGAEEVAGESRPLTIGIVADVHQDVMHDGYARINYFIEEMNKSKADFIMQLGDFSLPHSWNQPFIDKWNEFKGPRYHVLGNHDMDHGFSKQKTMQWWNMPGKFYSFDRGGFHFVILDGNDANPGTWSGYHRYMGTEQQAWLKADLAGTKLPTLIFSHQSIEQTSGGVANGAAIRALLEQANRQAKWNKVFACLSGHHHTDYLKEINGIAYIQINSMSYKWLGGDYRRTRFRPHIERTYPWVSYTAPYRDPLYAVLRLDATKRQMTIKGTRTEFIPPAPVDMDLPNAAQMTATITDRQLKIPQP